MRWALLTLALPLPSAACSTAAASLSSRRCPRRRRHCAWTDLRTPRQGGSRRPRSPRRRTRWPDPGMSGPGSSAALQPGVPSNPEDMAPDASEQRVFKSRKALETINPRELVR